jgi:predicted signal transduction protein with EAL and GGDEF domain
MDAAEDERELFRFADEALYASKNAGRACVTLYCEMSAPKARSQAA